jgi:hypothetical protein
VVDNSTEVRKGHLRGVILKVTALANWPAFNYKMCIVKCTQWGAYWTVLLTHYSWGDKIEKNEMDGECSAYGGEERCMQGFGGETWGKETTWETQA